MVAHSYANTLASFGHEVHVFTRTGQGKVPPQHPNVTVHTVRFLPLPVFFGVSVANGAVKEILRMGNDFDIVHVHPPMTMLSKKHYGQLRGGIVQTLHGTWRNERERMKLREVSPNLEGINEIAVITVSHVTDPLEEIAMSHSNGLIMISDQEMGHFADHGVANLSDRVVKIPSGVDTSLFDPKPTESERAGFRKRFGFGRNDRVLISVGRLVIRKNFAALIDTFSKIIKNVPEARLLIVGEGPLEDGLNEQVRTLGLEGKVVFTSNHTFQELARFYACADLFVFTPYYEGQGLVIMESMSAGTPCVSTDVGGVPEMIRQGVDGYHFPLGDYDRMVKHVTELLRDDSKMTSFSKEARKSMVEMWDWKVVCRKIEKVYENILKDPRDSPLRTPGSRQHR